MKNGIKLLWLASIGVAFFSGYYLKPLTQQTAVVASQENNKALLTNDFQDVFTEKSTPVISPSAKTTITDQTKPRVFIEDVVAKLKSFSLNPNTFDLSTLAETYLLIKDLDEEQILATLSEFGNDLSDPKNRMSLMLLMNKYGEVNPENAIDYANNNIAKKQTKKMTIETIISSWAKQDPNAAYNWYQRNEKSDLNEQSFALVSIFKSFANINLNGAIDKIYALKNKSKDTNMALIGITASLQSTEDFQTMLTRSDEFENKGIKNQIIGSWAAKDPQEASQWLDSIDDNKEKIILQAKVFSTWIHSDPQEAADWYLNQANEDKSQKYANKIVSSWGRNNPEDALYWLNQQPSINNDKTIATLIASSAYNNPDFAISNIELLSNTKDKKNVSWSIYRSLKYKDKEKAAEFLASSPYKEEIQSPINPKYQKKKHN